MANASRAPALQAEIERGRREGRARRAFAHEFAAHAARSGRENIRANQDALERILRGEPDPQPVDERIPECIPRSGVHPYR